MNYFAPSTSSSTKTSDKVWMGLWILFGISLFVSKSGISLFGTVLLLWSLFKVDWKSAVRSNPWFAVIISFFPIVILLSFLSLAGGSAAVQVIRGWPWPLYVIPFSLLFVDKKTLKAFSWAMAVGLVVACVKALEVFGTKWGWHFDSQTRVDSFWDIGRWAYFLACTCIVLFALMGSKSFSATAKRFEKVAVLILFFIALAFLILVNARGPWLAAVGGIGLLGISGKKYFKMLCGFLIVVVCSLLVVPGTLSRLQSSFSAKKENGVITSSDASNAARFHMWKVNGDFYKEQLWFGTGFDSAQIPLRAFIEKQSDEYKAKYIDSEFSFHDQHDSYLWILVQTGLIFCLYFWGTMLWIFVKSIATFFKTDDVMFKAAFAAVAAQLFMFIFYSAVSSYETIWLFPALFVLSRKQQSKASHV